jgi:hypothetical protein
VSYETYEADDRNGGVVTLYKFRVGPGEEDYVRFTDADSIVYRDGYPFTPIAIKRTNIQRSGSLDKADMKLTVAGTNPIAQMFLRYPPSYVVTVEIFEGHFDDYERAFLTIWQGRVLNCAFQQDNSAELSCQPGSTSMRRIGLRRHYQKGCPLDLYGPECRATKTEVECDFVSFAGNTLTGVIPGGGLPQEAEAYATGILQWVSTDHGRTEIRSILSCVEDGLNFILTLNGPISHVPETFVIIKGCLHTERTCSVWHDNIVNYGGQLWIPDKNPVGTTSTYL